MGFLQRLKAAFQNETEKGVDPRRVYEQTAQIIGVWQPPLHSPVDADPLAEQAEINPTIARAVKVIARECGRVPLVLTRRLDQGRSREIIDQHPAIDLFRWINPFDTPTIWFEDLYSCLLTYGDAFSWMQVEDGVPVSLIRLLPSKVSPIPHPKEIISGYQWETTLGDVETYPAREILHFKTRNVESIYRGASPLEALRTTIKLDNAARQWNISRFRNNMASTLVLSTQKRITSDEEMARLKDALRRKMGPQHAGEPLILDGEEWSVTHIPRPDEQEAGFIELMRFNVAEVAKVLGVPPSVLQDFSDSFRSNSKAQDKQFFTSTVMSWHQLVLDVLNTSFLPRFWPGERDLQFQYDYSQVEALAFSQFEQAQVNEILVRSGIRTPNEARFAMGFDLYDDPAADVLYVNGRELGSDPFELPGFGPAEDPSEEPEDEDPEAQVDDRGKVLLLKPNIKVPVDELLDPNEEEALLRRKLREVIREMVRVAGEQQLSIDQVSGAFNMQHPAVLEFIERQTIRLAKDYTGTTIQRLRLAVAEGLTQGLPIREMRSAIQASFSDRRRDWELDRVARTEVHQAQEGGGVMAAEQNGVELKRWVSARDSVVRGPGARNRDGDPDPELRADHAAMDGQVVPIGARFTDPLSQAQLAFPGDRDGAVSGADVINCRCTWVAEFPDDVENKRYTDPDAAWLKKGNTRKQFETAMRLLFRKHVDEMEQRAMAELDRQETITRARRLGNHADSAEEAEGARQGYQS